MAVSVAAVSRTSSAGARATSSPRRPALMCSSGKAIALYAKGMADAILAGREQALNGLVEEIAEGSEEFVEVQDEQGE